MGETFLWWLTIEALGLVALPIAALLMRTLPDRGYTAAKPLGLLIVGWLAYTLSMLKLAPFGRLLLFGCMLALAAFSAWLLLRDGRAMLADLRARFRAPAFLRHIIAAELLFALLLAVWAYFRAFNPDIIDQEKFMDFGILNSILKSGTLPPNDMWFAGQPVNYYYFGYILMAAVTSISGVAPAISFNLANAALFALTGLVAYGAVYNLILGTMGRKAPRPVTAPVSPIETQTARLPNRGVRPVGQARSSGLAFAGSTGTYAAVVDEDVASAPLPARRAGTGRREAEQPGAGGSEGGGRTPLYLSPILYGVLAALMVVAMGNLAVPFGKKDTSNGANINANGWSFCFFCPKEGYDYWWAPSRVIMDYRTTVQPGGVAQKAPVGYETINEFPAFSFVLGDMHPHVMALPFVLLAVLSALALARRKIAGSNLWRDGIPRTLAAWTALLLTALIAGSLYPTNTWDYPTYLLVILLGMALPYIAAGRKPNNGGWRWVRPFIVQTALLVAISLLLFLPFHLTFKSFAGGDSTPLPENIAGIPVLGGLLQMLSGLFLINTADKTITGFLVIFGVFLVALLGWVGYEFVAYARRQSRAAEGRNNTLLVSGAFLGVTLLLAVLLKFPLLGLLLPLIVACAYLIWQEPRRTERNMALGLFMIAAAIGLTVEIFYLRDNFGNRMNTLFKFYYQMWVLWALAAAYGFWRVLQAVFGKPRSIAANASSRSAQSAGVTTGNTSAGVKVLAGVWAASFLLLVLSALPYAWYGSKTRNIGDRSVPQGLDGSTFLKSNLPGDYAAIQWLNANASGSDVLLECCRNEYDWPGRMSAFTGIPTLLAWDNSHELLWRAGQPTLKTEIGKRRQVVDAIYQGTDPDSPGSPLTPQKLLSTLGKYSVDYVVAGEVERGLIQGRTGTLDKAEQLTPYAESVMKAANMPIVFQQGSTIIYGVQGARADPNTVVPTPVAAPPTVAGGAAQPDLNVPPASLFDRGPAGANRGQFNLPRTITRDAQGNFYVADTENKRIQKFDPAGKWLLMFGGKGSGDGQFEAISADSVGTGPGSVAVDSKGNIYVADTWNHRIQEFDPNGKFLAKWGSFVNLADPNSAGEKDTDSRFYGPRGVAIGPDGNVYVTDTGNKRVLIFSEDGKFVRKIDSGLSPAKTAPAYPFSQPGELNEPIGIAVDPAGNVYVADTNNRRIQKFDKAGKPVAQFPIPANNWTPGPYLEPFLALDATGNLYATAPTGGAVLKFSPTGQLLGTKSSQGTTQLSLPTGVWADKDGTLYVVDTMANTVVKIGKMP